MPSVFWSKPTCDHDRRREAVACGPIVELRTLIDRATADRLGRPDPGIHHRFAMQIDGHLHSAGRPDASRS
jgi:hypothetical protein